MDAGLSAKIRETLPRVEDLREQARGDSDLELVVTRIEQIEMLLEGLAERAGATGDGKRATAAEAKIAANRRLLQGPVG